MGPRVRVSRFSSSDLLDFLDVAVGKAASRGNREELGAAGGRDCGRGLGFVADARGWDVPTWIWSTLALAFVGWAILLAYHELRTQCDAAMDGLTDKRNHRAIADGLTERYRHGVHELAHKAPPHSTTHNDAESFKQAFGEWLAAVFAWNDEVKALMEKYGCTPQEISYFWTINELKPGMMLRGD